ncbi:hypothetical protein CPC08DRAFT_450079 [Agrocybe pediades]|nr:hypothetical protein CPC08DRAFT_450079 [Agrocybe pediades]
MLFVFQWAGYSSEDNSWEPEENVAGCGRLLKSFWKHLRMRPEDYKGDQVLEARQEWIEQEKEFFDTQFRDKKRKLKMEREKLKQQKQKEQEQREKEKKKKARRSVSKTLREPGSSSEPEVPAEPKKSLKITINKRPRTVISSSSDDEPLIQRKRHKSASVAPEAVPSSPPLASPADLFTDDESPAIKKKLPTKTPSLPIISQKAPEAKIANMPQILAAPTGGISTKQRLAQGALAPTQPKDLVNAKPKAGPLPPPPARRNSTSQAHQHQPSLFGGLRFKKSTVPARPTSPGHSNTAPTTPVVQEPTLASLNLTSSPIQDDFVTHSLPVTPQVPAYTPNAVSSLFSSHEGPHLDEAEMFLQDLQADLPELAGPLRPTLDGPFEPQPPKSLHGKIKEPEPSSLPKKKWQWTGPVFFGKEEKPRFNGILNPVIVTDRALKFGSFFHATESLRISKLYDNIDMRSNWLAFRKPNQMCLLSAEDESELANLRVLVAYLKKKQQHFLVPAILDGNTIGQIIFFPWNENQSTLPISVPTEFQEIQGDTHLIAVIMLYLLEPTDIDAVKMRPPVLEDDLRPLSEPFGPQVTWEKSLASKPYFHYGIRTLGFDKRLFEHLSQYSRSYCIWPQNNSFENRCLEAILSETQATRVPPTTADARMIFVHVKALDILHGMPGLVERRATQGVQFLCFGSSDVDEPMGVGQGIREIYPLGGVVTFTPAVMQYEPNDVCELIRRIDAHPLWCAYILPVSLGVLSKLECKAEDPLKTFDENKLMLNGILQTIEQGSLALTSSPPKPHSSELYSSQLEEWQLTNLELTPPTRRDALCKGIAAFIQQKEMLHAPAGALQGLIEKEIARDMVGMQRQPGIMRCFRRFVVVDRKENVDARMGVGQGKSGDGKSTEGSGKGTEGGGKRREMEIEPGMEWLSIDKFSFQDDYFPKNA